MRKEKQKRRLLSPFFGAVLFAVTVVVVPGCNKTESKDETRKPTPVITEEPGGAGNADLTDAPEPTEIPTLTPTPTVTPRPTSTPRPTATPKPTKAPEPLPQNNVVTNGEFSSDTSGWGLYKESGGAASVGTLDGRLALNITSVGTLNYAVQIYPEDIIKLEKGKEYRVRYDVYSTEKRSIEVMIQKNGGNYQSYTWKKVDLKQTPQTIDYTFIMTGATDENTKLVFNCGTQGTDLPEHVIYVDNVCVSLVENKATEKAPEDLEPSVRVNQVGYLPESKKVAVFADIVGETKFSVVNAQTHQEVYSGAITGETFNSSANEINSFGDFSEVKEPGRYYIRCGKDVMSYEFEIGDGVMDELLQDAVKMLYLQRCGCEVIDDDFGHVACHTGLAKIYGTEELIDVSGGWHDAGDYGRYVVPAAKTVADLLYAYESAKGLYGDNTGIPESGNGVPDVLDEVRYELEWMLKMQSASGGVYHKVSCGGFPGYLMPERETAQLFVTPVSTTATADFCGAMAMAYEFFFETDRSFAETCLAAAERAWDFLEKNPKLIFENPATITTGAYNDSSDKDERYWAAAQMYRATKKETYLTALEKMTVRSGLDWSNVGDYGNIALLTMEGIDKESTVYTRALDSVMRLAQGHEGITSGSTYGVAVSGFEWGSNMTIANAGVVLALAYELSGDEIFLDAARSHLNYLLGTNPLGMSFVTGYGTVSPKNPHHRPSIAKKKAMSGMLVGGVNSRLEDSAAKKKLEGVPAAKCYVDDKESYSTNEITIYWNSPLVYLLSLTKK